MLSERKYTILTFTYTGKQIHRGVSINHLVLIWSLCPPTLLMASESRKTKGSKGKVDSVPASGPRTTRSRVTAAREEILQQ